jgi:hypothetical protein
LLFSAINSSGFVHVFGIILMLSRCFRWEKILPQNIHVGVTKAFCRKAASKKIIKLISPRWQTCRDCYCFNNKALKWDPLFGEGFTSIIKTSTLSTFITKSLEYNTKKLRSIRKKRVDAAFESVCIKMPGTLSYRVSRMIFHSLIVMSNFNQTSAAAYECVWSALINIINKKVN